MAEASIVLEPSPLGWARVNPQLSLVRDRRYDPCRPGSKLGIPLDQLVALVEHNSPELMGVQGLHLHTNCDARSFAPMLSTVRHLDAHLPTLLAQCTWLNLGGGYLYNSISCLDDLDVTVRMLDSRYGTMTALSDSGICASPAPTAPAAVDAPWMIA